MIGKDVVNGSNDSLSLKYPDEKLCPDLIKALKGSPLQRSLENVDVITEARFLQCGMDWILLFLLGVVVRHSCLLVCTHLFHTYKLLFKYEKRVYSHYSTLICCST